MPEITDAEYQFLREHDGGLGAALADLGRLGGPRVRTPKSDAQEEIDRIIAKITDHYDNRMQRLMVLALLADAAKDARDDLLGEVMRDSFSWSLRQDPAALEEVVEGQEWGGYSLLAQSYLRDNLASVAGLSPATIRKRMAQAIRDSLDAAIAAQRGAAAG